MSKSLSVVNQQQKLGPLAQLSLLVDCLQPCFVSVKYTRTYPTHPLPMTIERAFTQYQRVSATVRPVSA